MALQIGYNNFGHIYVGSTEIAEAYFGSIKVFPDTTPDYNPLGLPPYTMRFQFDNSAVDPTTLGVVDGTWSQVSSDPNVWDYTKTISPTDWENVFSGKLIKNDIGTCSVLGANTESVYYMGNMFGSCSSLKAITLFDTSSVLDMWRMFYGCSSLQAVPRFDTSSVNTMTGMFYGCALLQSVPLFNTSSATQMTGMFEGCTLLQSVPLFDTSSATSMDIMFKNCSNIQTVPLFNTSSVVSMIGMFSSCSSLQSVPLFDTSSVTSMYNMFWFCSSLQSVPLFDTSSVTAMNGMFYGCSSLQSVPLFDTSSVTNMNGTFDGCTDCATGALALYTQASTQANPPTNHSNCFTNCGRDTTTGAAELAQIPTSWGGTMS